MKFSIIIPTFNHCDDLLKPCIESIIKYTDLTDIEVIVVANGCIDNTREYVENLGSSFKLLWYPEAMGYINATNAGIINASGDYIILLNNDTVLLEQTKNTWISRLVSPFNDSNTGITGVHSIYSAPVNTYFLSFFCVMISKNVFDTIGLLDPIFSPGGGDDVDFCLRAKESNFGVISVGGSEIQDFPIYHKLNQTLADNDLNYFDNKEFNQKIKVLLCKRHNKDIKINIGISKTPEDGSILINPYKLSDNNSEKIYDGIANDYQHAIFNMDLKNLDFDRGTVQEITVTNIISKINPTIVLDVFREWNRVLVNNGKLVIEIDNIDAIFQSFLNETDLLKRLEIMKSIFRPVNITEIPEQCTSISYSNSWAWWPDAITQYLKIAGFNNINIHTNETNDKFIVQAQK